MGLDNTMNHQTISAVDLKDSSLTRIVNPTDLFPIVLAGFKISQMLNASLRI